MGVRRFGVSLEEAMLQKLDKLVVDNNFSNRSQAIRFLIEQLALEKKWKEDRLVAGVLVLVYDHHKKDISGKSMDIQHDYHHLIMAVQHVHLDHENCLETISLRGRAADLQSLANRLIGIKGMKDGKLVMSSVGK